VIWAVADHPWVQDSDGAAVRVTLSVVAAGATTARLVSVDEHAQVIGVRTVARALNADLSADADIASASAVSLRSNDGLSSPGLKLHGSGFIMDATEADEVRTSQADAADVVRPYLNGRDLAQRSRGHFVIDFGLRDEADARHYVVPFQIVLDRVKPERDANNDRSTRSQWWRFGRNREEFRPALTGLARFIATTETAKHRWFAFVPAEVAPDNMLVCVASADAFVLGGWNQVINATAEQTLPPGTRSPAFPAAGRSADRPPRPTAAA
jgi:hypothetical protein